MGIKNVFKSGIVSLLALLGGCTKSVVYDETKPYLDALAKTPMSRDPAAHAKLGPWLRMFSNITSESIYLNIEQVYANDLFFNDTIHTFKTRDEVKAYFLSFAKSTVVTLEPLSLVEQGDDIWLQWKMRLQFEVGRKSLDITSIGMSLLRFNEDGLIVLHQDFWDGANGLYAHLPLVGGAIRSIQERLGDVED